MGLSGVGCGGAMCAPWGRGFSFNIFRDVAVVWVALELSGTFAVNGVSCFHSLVKPCIPRRKWRNISSCTLIVIYILNVSYCISR